MGLELDGPVPQHCVCDIPASVTGNLFCHQHMLHLFGGIFFLVAWNKKTSIFILLSQTCQHDVKKSQDFVQTGHFCCEPTWGL